jgi:hypothetical protein
MRRRRRRALPLLVHVVLGSRLRLPWRAHTNDTKQCEALRVPW